LRGFLVGEALLGLLSSQPAVPGSPHGVGACLSEVVGKGRNVARPAGFDRLGAPGMQPGSAQPGQALVQSVADQRMREADPAWSWLDHQAGEKPGLDGVGEHVFLGSGNVAEHVGIGLRAQDRCLPENRLGAGRQPGDPP